jgi:hypothetical protein
MPNWAHAFPNLLPINPANFLFDRSIPILTIDCMASLINRTATSVDCSDASVGAGPAHFMFSL